MLAMAREFDTAMDKPDPVRLVVLISGRGTNLAALIEASSTPTLDRADIVGVISDQASAQGLEKARLAGIETTVVPRSEALTKQAFEEELGQAIGQYKPDWIILAGFMQVLSASFLAPLSGRVINIHPSLLPKYRGLHTHQRALDAKDVTHGASTHFVTPELDGGPVIAQIPMAIEPTDDAASLATRLLPLEHQLLIATVALLVRHEVKCSHESISIDGQTLATPLVLGRDLGDDGTVWFKPGV